MEAEIKFEPSGRSGLVPTGTYLFDAAKRLGVEMEDECERRGECDSCALEILEGGEFLSDLTKAEIEQLDEARRARGERLACQTKIEKSGAIVVKTKEKKKKETEATEENKIEEFQKEFADLPLEKKVATLLEMEMVTLSETFSFVLNSPYKIVGKVMEVMAEFGLKQEKEEKNAKRPTEHAEEENESANGNGSSNSKKKNQAEKKASSKSDAAKDSPDDETGEK